MTLIFRMSICLIISALFLWGCKTSSHDGSNLADSGFDQIDLQRTWQHKVFVRDTRHEDGKLTEIVLNLWQAGSQSFTEKFEFEKGSVPANAQGELLANRLKCKVTNSAIQCRSDDGSDGRAIVELLFSKDSSDNYEIFSETFTKNSSGNLMSSGKKSLGRGFKSKSFFNEEISCVGGGYTVRTVKGKPIASIESTGQAIDSNFAVLTCSERFSHFSCNSYGIFGAGFAVEVKGESELSGKLTQLSGKKNITTNLTCSKGAKVQTDSGR
jgi:hypothetical protein